VDDTKQLHAPLVSKYRRDDCYGGKGRGMVSLLLRAYECHKDEITPINPKPFEPAMRVSHYLNPKAPLASLLLTCINKLLLHPHNQTTRQNTLVKASVEGDISFVQVPERKISSSAHNCRKRQLHHVGPALRCHLA